MSTPEPVREIVERAVLWLMGAFAVGVAVGFLVGRMTA